MFLINTMYVMLVVNEDHVFRENEICLQIFCQVKLSTFFAVYNLNVVLIKLNCMGDKVYQ